MYTGVYLKMSKYVNVRLTKQEYDFISQVRDKMVEEGLPMEILGDQEIAEYLKSVKRDSIAKGALVGLGLFALLHLLKKKAEGR